MFKNATRLHQKTGTPGKNKTKQTLLYPAPQYMFFARQRGSADYVVPPHGGFLLGDSPYFDITPA